MAETYVSAPGNIRLRIGKRRKCMGIWKKIERHWKELGKTWIKKYQANSHEMHYLCKASRFTFCAGRYVCEE